MKKWPVFIALLALLAILAGISPLLAVRKDLVVESRGVDDIPVKIFRPAGPGNGEVVVIAHGFAGSQQLMQSLALTLANSGYVALTFDFAGHGRNQLPMRGGVRDMEESTRTLLFEIDRVTTFARGLSGGKSIALVGHSMGADLVVQYAMNRPEVGAVVALSVFGAGVTRSEPRNLIVITGEWEPAMLTDAAARIVGLASNGPPLERVTYGDVAEGAARRYVLARGAEHIGVIFSRDGLTEARDWLNKVFQQNGEGVVDSTGKWLALLFVGLFALAYPLARCFPVLSASPLGAGLGWRKLAPAAVAPAVLTPLLLWKAPTNFLPILLGDYLAVHFIIYGLLSAAGLWLMGGKAALGDCGWRRALMPAVLLAAFYILGPGMALDAFVTSFMPSGQRWFILWPMLLATAIYFHWDEWLTRGAGAASGGYVFSKVCFLASLLFAAALNPEKLFFLVIIVPVIFLFFIVYGLVSRWTYERIGDPRVAALGNAAALAFAIAVTFPMVD